MKDCQEAIRKTVPLAKTAKDKIDAIRSWAKGNARMASSKEEATVSDRTSELEFGFEKGSN
jgi:hypothetical protein